MPKGSILLGTTRASALLHGPGHLVGIELPGKANPVLESVLGRKVFEVLPCRTIAGDDHHHIEVTIGDLRESLRSGDRIPSSPLDIRPPAATTPMISQLCIPLQRSPDSTALALEARNTVGDDAFSSTLSHAEASYRIIEGELGTRRDSSSPPESESQEGRGGWSVSRRCLGRPFPSRLGG